VPGCGFIASGTPAFGSSLCVLTITQSDIAGSGPNFAATVFLTEIPSGLFAVLLYQPRKHDGGHAKRFSFFELCR